MFLNFLKRKNKDKVMNDKVIQKIINWQPGKWDPDGSYTGVPDDEFSKPVQGRDDL